MRKTASVRRLEMLQYLSHIVVIRFCDVVKIFLCKYWRITVLYSFLNKSSNLFQQPADFIKNIKILVFDS